MLAPIPYLDITGYKLRSEVVPTDLDMVESLYPGFIAHGIARVTSRINAQLTKRYLVPLGQTAPLLVAYGTLPPKVTLSGRPTLGSLEMAIEITTPGALGTAAFQWSQDGGGTFTTGVLTSSSVALGTTGLVASFLAGPYAADNEYFASTPVPEIALGWLVAILDLAVMRRRGYNAQDPAGVLYSEAAATAYAEIAQAANSNDGLFELPTNDAVGDSAINHGGPMAYSECSPFVSADQQEFYGRQEDAAGSGFVWGT